MNGFVLLFSVICIGIILLWKKKTILSSQWMLLFHSQLSQVNISAYILRIFPKRCSDKIKRQSKPKRSSSLIKCNNFFVSLSLLLFAFMFRISDNFLLNSLFPFCYCASIYFLDIHYINSFEWIERIFILLYEICQQIERKQIKCWRNLSSSNNNNNDDDFRLHVHQWKRCGARRLPTHSHNSNIAFVLVFFSFVFVPCAHQTK